eukprot:12038913-Ditylum_brightwellii.AAC.1
MESTSPGFVAHLKEIPTLKRYKAATAFVDHFSDATYIYLQESLSFEQTLAAKVEYKAWARDKGALIRHYHTDNGRFANNLFIQGCRSKGKTISYCK